VAFIDLERESKGNTERERKTSADSSVPFRCPAAPPVTMPRSNCSLFSDRTLPRRSTRY